VSIPISTPAGLPRILPKRRQTSLWRSPPPKPMPPGAWLVQRHPHPARTGLTRLRFWRERQRTHRYLRLTVAPEAEETGWSPFSWVRVPLN